MAINNDRFRRVSEKIHQVIHGRIKFFCSHIPGDRNSEPPSGVFQYVFASQRITLDPAIVRGNRAHGTLLHAL